MSGREPRAAATKARTGISEVAKSLNQTANAAENALGRARPADDSSAGMDTNVPAFLKCLWEIVNNDANARIISWNAAGDAVVIHDKTSLEAIILPKYFKHNNYTSFVRQLNMYDFSKISQEGKEFQQALFKRGRPDLLVLIKRKAATVAGQRMYVAAQGARPVGVHAGGHVAFDGADGHDGGGGGPAEAADAVVNEPVVLASHASALEAEILQLKAALAEEIKRTAQQNEQHATAIAQQAAAIAAQHAAIRGLQQAHSVTSTALNRWLYGLYIGLQSAGFVITAGSEMTGGGGSGEGQLTIRFKRAAGTSAETAAPTAAGSQAPSFSPSPSMAVAGADSASETDGQLTPLLKWYEGSSARSSHGTVGAASTAPAAGASASSSPTAQFVLDIRIPSTASNANSNSAAGGSGDGEGSQSKIAKRRRQDERPGSPAHPAPPPALLNERVLTLQDFVSLFFGSSNGNGNSNGNSSAAAAAAGSAGLLLAPALRLLPLMDSQPHQVHLHPYSADNNSAAAGAAAAAFGELRGEPGAASGAGASSAFGTFDGIDGLAESDAADNGYSGDGGAGIGDDADGGAPAYDDDGHASSSVAAAGGTGAGSSGKAKRGVGRPMKRKRGGAGSAAPASSSSSSVAAAASSAPSAHAPGYQYYPAVTPSTFQPQARGPMGAMFQSSPVHAYPQQQQLQQQHQPVASGAPGSFLLQPPAVIPGLRRQDSDTRSLLGLGNVGGAGIAGPAPAAGAGGGSNVSRPPSTTGGVGSSIELMLSAAQSAEGLLSADSADGNGSAANDGGMDLHVPLIPPSASASATAAGVSSGSGGARPSSSSTGTTTTTSATARMPVPLAFPMNRLPSMGSYAGIEPPSPTPAAASGSLQQQHANALSNSLSASSSLQMPSQQLMQRQYYSGGQMGTSNNSTGSGSSSNVANTAAGSANTNNSINRPPASMARMDSLDLTFAPSPPVTQQHLPPGLQQHQQQNLQMQPYPFSYQQQHPQQQQQQAPQLTSFSSFEGPAQAQALYMPGTSVNNEHNSSNHFAAANVNYGGSGSDLASLRSSSLGFGYSDVVVPGGSSLGLTPQPSILRRNGGPAIATSNNAMGMGGGAPNANGGAGRRGPPGAAGPPAAGGGGLRRVGSLAPSG